MATNPQLDASGLPVPFEGEMMVLARGGVEFQVDSCQLTECPGGKWTSRGTIFLSSIRMVFVASHPRPPIVAFDMPLLFVHDEKFNQPIFACNNLSGKVHRVFSETLDRSSNDPHNFKILFKEGGVGTFIPVFFNLLHALRAISSEHMPRPSYSDDGESSRLRSDPLPVEQPPVDELIRHAYVDPNDPSQLYLQQPPHREGLRRRTYNPAARSMEESR